MVVKIETHQLHSGSKYSRYKKNKSGEKVKDIQIPDTEANYYF